MHFKHKNITHLSLLYTNKIMKAISNLANVLKRKPLVTAQQEQETRDLTQLVEATSLQGTLPGVQDQHKNITHLSLLHANKIMKAISDLANVLKRKPLVTAQKEQENLNLTHLVEATSIKGTLLRVPIQHKDATVLKVNPTVSLPKVPETEQLESM